MSDQKKIYVPLIKEFAENTKGLYKNLWTNRIPDSDMSGLFIPHAFNGYDSAKTKIFYVGQDTYNWPVLNNVYTLSPEKYLELNNQWPSGVEDILEWKNSYTFWNFVCRVQLAFNGMEFKGVNNISAKEKSVLNGIGWGNIYSLEIDETNKKYGEDFASSYDKGVFAKMHEEARKVSKIKNILKAYRPDYIVILAWKNVEDWLLEGLDVQFIAEESIESLLSCYIIKDTGTKIMWTYHPQALCRKSVDLAELTEMLKKRM